MIRIWRKAAGIRDSDMVGSDAVLKRLVAGINSGEIGFDRVIKVVGEESLLAEIARRARDMNGNGSLFAVDNALPALKSAVRIDGNGEFVYEVKSLKIDGNDASWNTIRGFTVGGVTKRIDQLGGELGVEESAVQAKLGLTDEDIVQMFRYIDITTKLDHIVKGLKIVNGKITIIMPHTSAFLITAENENPSTLKDLADAAERVAPSAGTYEHHKYGDDNGRAHVLHSFFGNPSIIRIVEDGQMSCGKWEKILVIDPDPGTRPRQLQVEVKGWK